MKSNPKNPQKITKNPPSTTLPKNHQQNTKKYQQNTKKYQHSPKINNKNPNFQIRELKEIEGKKQKQKKKTINPKNTRKTPNWLHRCQAVILRTPAPSSTTALSQNCSSSLSPTLSVSLFHLPVYVKKLNK
jgi:hypothetical protein